MHRLSLVAWRRWWIALLILTYLMAACAPIVPPTPEGGPAPQAAPPSTSVITQARQTAPPPSSPHMVQVRQNSAEQCTIHPDGTGYTSRGGSDLPTNNPILHGEWVWSTAQAQLAELGAQRVMVADGLLATDNRVALLIMDRFSEPITQTHGAGETKPPTERVRRAELWRFADEGSARADGEILLVALDIENFNLAMVTDELEDALYGLGRGARLTDTVSVDVLVLPPIHRFVLNMSWVIIPCAQRPLPTQPEGYLESICDALDEERRISLPSLVQMYGLLSDLSDNFPTGRDFCADVLTTQAIPDDVDRVALEQLLNHPNFSRAWIAFIYESIYGFASQEPRFPETDLAWLLNCLAGVAGYGLNNETCAEVKARVRSASGEGAPPSLIAVAAAGNSGTPPSPSSLYPLVPALWDSVVSVSANDAQGYVSNGGEIALPGLHPGPLDDATIVEGTSFAAPRLSVWQAVYLMSGFPTPCSPRTDIIPVLGHKGYREQGNWASLAHGSNRNINLRLGQAAQSYCGDFSSMLRDWGYRP